MSVSLAVCGALLVLTLSLSGVSQAQTAPPLWGYGVKSCDDFELAWAGTEQGQEAAIAEYRRYQDWLAGLVSGLNLATGRDVLAGVEIEGALRRIHLHCQDHRKDDFFTAAMALVRQLSPLR
jgi:hypothetical protein